jgi:hypothetical protein
MTLSNTKAKQPPKSLPLEIGTAAETMREAIASDGEIEVYLEGTDIRFRPTQAQAQAFYQGTLGHQTRAASRL